MAIYIRVSKKHQIDKDSLKVRKIEIISYSKIVLNSNDHEMVDDKFSV